MKKNGRFSSQGRIRSSSTVRRRNVHHSPGPRGAPLVYPLPLPDTAILRQAHNNFSGFLYGLAFTKPNPTFYEDVAAKFPNKDAKILVMCQEGLR